MSYTAIVNTPYGGNYTFHFKVNEVNLLIDNQFQIIKFNNQFINIVASGAGSTYFRIGPSGNQYILNYLNCTNPKGSNYANVSDFIAALQNAINGTSNASQGLTTANDTAKLVQVESTASYKKFILFLNGAGVAASSFLAFPLPTPLISTTSSAVTATNTTENSSITVGLLQLTTTSNQTLLEISNNTSAALTINGVIEGY